MSGYWPWWMGALGLGGVTVGYYVALGRTIGISGAWERVLHWREERATEALDASMDDVDFEAALEAATLQAFAVQTAGAATLSDASARAWPPSPTEPPAHVHAPAGEAAPAVSPPTGSRSAVTTPTPVAAHATLLLFVLLGGFLAAVVSGRFELRGDMGPAFADLVVSGNGMWPVLFVGGVLVGFGTRLAGGCSSGHGLSGCSRFQPASIVATAVFFGTAVAVSTLLWKVI
ncbi:MAG: YeeE/YedE thiosulfate transporter family protein [Acidimicrobiales bacterium]